MVSSLVRISGGAISGGLHALSGPDHLTTLIPFILDKNAFQCLCIGALWGLGHGLTACVMGYVGYLIKLNLISDERVLGHVPFDVIYSVFVGLTFLVIGIQGIREIAGLDLHFTPSDSSEHSLSSCFAYFASGCIFGMSWDGLPSLAPVLALQSHHHVLCHLLSYCFGTLAAMSLAVGVLSVVLTGIRRVSFAEVPKVIGLAASCISILVGLGCIAPYAYPFLLMRQTYQVLLGVVLVIYLIHLAYSAKYRSCYPSKSIVHNV